MMKTSTMKVNKRFLREFLFSSYTSLSYAEFSVLTYADLKPIKVKTGETYPLLCNVS